MIPRLLLLALFAGSPAFAVDAERAAAGFDNGGIPEPPLGDPPDPATVEARTEALSKELRCPVCQALSVADSNSEAARAMRQRIHDFVGQGYTDDQIVDYFTDRYGEWVRLEPPATGRHLLVGLAPLFAAVVGAGLIASRMNTKPAAGAGTGEAAPEVDPELRARVMAELSLMEAAPGVAAAPPPPPEATPVEAPPPVNYRDRVMAELNRPAEPSEPEQ